MPYLIIDDTRPNVSGAPLYFLRLGLGIFWECSHNISEAQTFATRALAARTLHASGKHRHGWRIVRTDT